MVDSIQIRRGTSAQWASSNPTLLAGEFGLDTSVGRIKIGDGSTAWVTLEFSTKVNTETGTTYTLALTDTDGIVEMNNGSDNTLTIPLNSVVPFPIGTIISITQLGAGTTTVAGATSVTLNGVSAGSGDLNEQFSGVSLYKRLTDTWIVQGAIGVVA